jgi:dihydroorotase
MIIDAKQDNPTITYEVTPHHALLPRTGEPLPRRDPNWKTNPPLRDRADSAAMREALREGTVDALATDHAPHAPAEKALPLAQAPFGVIALETALGAMLTAGVDPMQVIRLWTVGPARLWRRRPGTPAWEVPRLRRPRGQGWERRTGHANLTVIDPHREWTVDPDKFCSKGRNTPFAGARFRGRAVMTIVRGGIVMREGEVALRRTQGHPERSRGIS